MMHKKDADIEMENTKAWLEIATNEELAEFIETDHYFDDYEMAAAHYRHQIAKRLRRAESAAAKKEELKELE